KHLLVQKKLTEPDRWKESLSQRLSELEEEENPEPQQGEENPEPQQEEKPEPPQQEEKPEPPQRKEKSDMQEKEEARTHFPELVEQLQNYMKEKKIEGVTVEERFKEKICRAWKKDPEGWKEAVVRELEKESRRQKLLT